MASLVAELEATLPPPLATSNHALLVHRSRRSSDRLADARMCGASNTRMGREESIGDRAMSNNTLNAALRRLDDGRDEMPAQTALSEWHRGERECVESG